VILSPAAHVVKDTPNGPVYRNYTSASATSGLLEHKLAVRIRNANQSPLKKIWVKVTIALALDSYPYGQSQAKAPATV
jgi:hypothetical protein